MTPITVDIDMSSTELMLHFIETVFVESPAEEYSFIYSGHGDSW